MRLALHTALLSAMMCTRLAAAQESSPHDQIRLKSGDLLRGTIVSSENGVVTIDHPELGLIGVPLAKIESYGPIPPAAGPAAPAGSATPAEPNATPAVAATTPGAVGAVATDPPEPLDTGDWKVHLGFALAGNFAVHDEVTLRGSIGAKRETASDKTTLEAEYYYRLFNSLVTDNNVLAKVLQEWNFGDSPWLVFVQGQYQYDEFQPWTHRVSLYAGPGYRVLHDETMDLTFRVGAGATYENGDVNKLEPEALFAEDWTWRISHRQELNLNTSIAPNVEDFSDYRVQSQFEYRFLLDESKRGLSLTAGLRDIFLSKPAPDAKANELRIYAGLRYDF